VLAAVIGAAFVIGLQVAAILSSGTLSQASVLQSGALFAHAPDLDSALWWPARATLGQSVPLVGTLLISFAALALAVALVAPRFGEYAVAAAGAENTPASRAQRGSAFRITSPRRALRRKEWLLLRRDPWLVSQTLMQMLYLIPPAVLLWRSFQAGGGALNLLVPVLVMAAGQLAGGLAWLTISGEDAPDLVATAPVPPRFILRAKIEAVLGIIAVIFVPLIAVLAIASPWHAFVTGCGVIIAASSATAIQLWFRTQAKRSQFRRRQVSSRVATFAEAFSSIGWAATAAVTAISPVLAVGPALFTLVLLGGARFLSPRKQA
jgi:ABC-2 type transport system permease protein